MNWPQQTNYGELVDLIRESDEGQADPLTGHEERVLARIAGVFPSDQSVYRGAHKEQTYKSKKNGELIPYTDVECITAL